MYFGGMSQERGGEVSHCEGCSVPQAVAMMGDGTGCELTPSYRHKHCRALNATSSQPATIAERPRSQPDSRQHWTPRNLHCYSCPHFNICELSPHYSVRLFPFKPKPSNVDYLTPLASLTLDTRAPFISGRSCTMASPSCPLTASSGAAGHLSRLLSVAHSAI